MNTVTILTRHSWLFAQQTFFSDLIIFLTWGIIQLCKMFLNAAEALLDVVYSITGFITAPAVQDYISKFQPFLWILLAFSAFLLGWQLIVNKNEERSHLLQNFLIATIVITSLPIIVLQISNMTFAASNYARDVDLGSGQQTVDNLSTADEIILSNTYDLWYLYQNYWSKGKDFKAVSSEENPYLEENAEMKPINDIKDMNLFDPYEKMWINDPPYNGTELFTSELSYVDDDGTILKTPVAEKIEDHTFLHFLIACYYRFYIDFWPIVLTLIFTALVMFFASYKVARLIWELGFHQFLAVLFAAGDITGGQKIKAILKSMGSIFLTIFLISVILKFFLVFVSYLTSMDINGFLKALLICFVALAAIDGPNIIEKILGVDAGIKSGFLTFMAATRGARAAYHGARAVGHGVSRATHTVRNTASRTREAAESRNTASASNTGTANGDNGNQQTASQAGRATQGNTTAFNAQAVNEQSRTENHTSNGSNTATHQTAAQENAYGQQSHVSADTTNEGNVYDGAETTQNQQEVTENAVHAMYQDVANMQVEQTSSHVGTGAAISTTAVVGAESIGQNDMGVQSVQGQTAENRTQQQNQTNATRQEKEQGINRSEIPSTSVDAMRQKAVMQKEHGVLEQNMPNHTEPTMPRHTKQNMPTSTGQTIPRHTEPVTPSVQQQGSANSATVQAPAGQSFRKSSARQAVQGHQTQSMPKQNGNDKADKKGE